MKCAFTWRVEVRTAVSPIEELKRHTTSLLYPGISYVRTAVSPIEELKQTHYLGCHTLLKVRTAVSPIEELKQMPLLHLLYNNRMSEQRLVRLRN